MSDLVLGVVVFHYFWCRVHFDYRLHLCEQVFFCALTRGYISQQKALNGEFNFNKHINGTETPPQR